MKMKEKHKILIQAVIVLGICVLILISLVTYHPEDLGIDTSHPNAPMHNRAGIVGAYLSWLLLQSIGRAAYLIPIVLFIQQLNRLRDKPVSPTPAKWLGTLVLLWSLATILAMLFSAATDSVRWKSGGAAGYFSSIFLREYLGAIGAYVVMLVLLLLALFLATEFQILSLFREAAGWGREAVAAGGDYFDQVLEKLGKRRSKRMTYTRERTREELPKRIFPVRPSGTAEAGAAKPGPEEREGLRKPVAIPPRPAPVRVMTTPASGGKPERRERPSVPAAAAAGEGKDYRLPGLDLLEVPPPVAERQIREDLNKNARVLEDTLRDFGIECRVVHIEQGPTITRYELEPAAGVRVQKITALNADIALAMKAQSVRIIAPIPGKARVGIEVPNSVTAAVYIREILESKEFREADSKLTLALGKNTAGEALVTDLADMPHLLIAGTTGSGKTVCVNSLICSFLFRARPEEVKFILVDPKKVELAPFDGIPHLLCPVVTDHKRVSAALNWVVAEMERRYELLARMGARNIYLYNEKIETFPKPERKAGGGTGAENGGEEESLEYLPFIIIIIDELADLMVVAANEIETAITRLAQLSRAVGIHIILATQRPSVDVVTGIIKANFPARISFQVASKVDSRTVLDSNGAEKLMGKGDMLFLDPRSSKLIRAQGTLTQETEIERVVNFVRAQRKPSYHPEILRIQEEEGKGGNYRSFEEDEYYEEAKKLVIETGQASVSMLQRRLGLGYQRAARLIDTMERKGIVGPYRGSRPREILVNAENPEAGREEEGKDNSR